MPPDDVKSSAGRYSPLGAAASRAPAFWERTKEAEEEPWWRKRMDELGGGGSGRWERRGRRTDWGRSGKGEEEERVPDPVRVLDEQLATLRETPVTIVSGPGKYAVSIDMNIFRPEDIEVLMSLGRLVVSAEREVLLDERTSVMRRFRRTLSIPDDVGTDAVAVHMSGRGILTITALRRMGSGM